MDLIPKNRLKKIQFLELITKRTDFWYKIKKGNALLSFTSFRLTQKTQKNLFWQLISFYLTN